jgi:hypothetical protein
MQFFDHVPFLHIQHLRPPLCALVDYTLPQSLADFSLSGEFYFAISEEFITASDSIVHGASRSCWALRVSDRLRGFLVLHPTLQPLR